MSIVSIVSIVSIHPRILLLLCAACTAGTACTASPLGRLCQPSDEDSCGAGYQCLTFCSGLDDVEVPPSAPQSICAPAFGGEARGTFTSEAVVNGRATFGEVANVRVMTEGLRIEITGVTGIAFPLLEEVGGNLTIVASGVECVSMPRLQRVGGTLAIDANPRLTRLDLGSLAEVDSLGVADNENLAELPLIALRELRGTTAADVIHVIEDNPVLEDVDFASLITVGGTLRVRGAAVVSLDAFGAGCLDIEGFDPDNNCPTEVGDTCDVIAGETTCCACADCSAPPSGCLE